MKTRYTAPLALALGVALLALGGCQKQAKAPEAPAAPVNQPGALISGGRLVLAAVPGHPAAAYFTLSNQASTPTSVIAVAVEGAGKAEMHTTTGTSMEPLPRLDLAAGETVLFAPGRKHVMVFDVAPKVVAGGTVEITLSTANGQKISGQLQVEAAGGMMPANGQMMDHEHMKM